MAHTPKLSGAGQELSAKRGMTWLDLAQIVELSEPVYVKLDEVHTMKSSAETRKQLETLIRSGRLGKKGSDH